jgi:hypothetical protein
MAADEWVCGPGGCDRKPVPPFEFQKEDTGGTAPKVLVRDAQGRTWSVKFGPEVIPECFGSRFVTALGYIAEPTYYVDCGRVEHAARLTRSRRVIKPDGSFRRGRFELRGQSDFEFLKGQTWSWVNNPFSGTRELAGLKIVMMLLSNWDAKDARDGDESNTNVFRVTQPGGGQELAYTVFDWGASLGRWGSVFRRDQSDCSSYVKDSPHFVRRSEGRLEWGFEGKHGEDMTTGVTVEDIRWLLPYLGRISPEQLRTGLSASGATPRQAACWAGGIEQRIGELRDAAR